MKTIQILFLSFACLFFIDSPAQTYHPFPSADAIWSVEGENAINLNRYRIRLGVNDDTLINGYSYHKIYQLYDSTLLHPLSTFYGAIREDAGKKVYAYLPGLGEHLLYDFSLQTGDTLWYNLGGVLSGNSAYYIENFPHYKVVTGIDSSLLLNNEYRKTWHLQANLSTDVWIEGIGSIYWFGLFNPLITDYVLNGDGYDFSCFKHNNQVLFLDNPFCAHCFCELLTAVPPGPDSDGSHLKVFPNPASAMLNVTLPDKAHARLTTLSILNCLGQAVRVVPLENSVTAIDISLLPSGFYFLQARDSEMIYMATFLKP